MECYRAVFRDYHPLARRGIHATSGSSIDNLEGSEVGHQGFAVLQHSTLQLIHDQIDEHNGLGQRYPRFRCVDGLRNVSLLKGHNS